MQENELKKNENEIDYLEKDIEGLKNKLENLKKENMNKDLKEIELKSKARIVNHFKLIIFIMLVK